MNKIIYIILPIVFIIALIVGYMFFNNQTDVYPPKRINDGWDKYRGQNIAVWKDAQNKIQYYEIPYLGGDDASYYLYDVKGDQILRTGGFVPSVEEANKHRALTAGLHREEFK